jgi:hypothetical protein
MPFPINRLSQMCIFIILISGLYACDDQGGQTLRSTAYDVEGPRGIVRTSGPWLVRVSIPEGTVDTSMQIKVNELVTQMPIEMTDFDLDQGVDQNNISLNRVELYTLELVESGREDIRFVLIPELPTDREYEYALWRNDIQISDVYTFRSLPLVADPLPPIEQECVVVLESPDPKMMVTSALDEAPQAGIQRRYSARAFPSRGGMVDQGGGSALMGLVTFEWLVVNDEYVVNDGIVASLYGGLARSEPFITPLGEQKLLITAHTVRWGRCTSIVSFSSP